jgi:hypothetical protein
MVQPTRTVPFGTFPSHDFPLVFADGVLSIANSPALVKFYLFRFDPEFAGGGQTQMQPTAQIVMSMDGFASALAFFEEAVRRYIAQGLITTERLAEWRKVHAQTEWKT